MSHPVDSNVSTSISKMFLKNITLGDAIQIAVLIIGGVIGYNKLEWRITSVENGFKEMREFQKSAVKVHEDLARSIVRLNTYEEIRRANVKHGVNPPLFND